MNPATLCLSIALLAALVAGCAARDAAPVPPEDAARTGEPAPPPDAHTSRNALDWEGTYTGVLPCADCTGIHTEISLRRDGTFARSRVYLGRDDGALRDAGTFAWDEQGRRVTLRAGDGDTRMYQVGENALWHLDESGNRITGDLAARFRLDKAVGDARIEGRRWVLTELGGRQVEYDEADQRVFLVLDGERSLVSGNTSCNRFSGPYEIRAGNRIGFAHNMGSTMMACADMTVERLFLDMLREADRYSLADGVLSLQRARGASLARFRVAGEPGT